MAYYLFCYIFNKKWGRRKNPDGQLDGTNKCIPTFRIFTASNNSDFTKKINIKQMKNNNLAIAGLFIGIGIILGAMVLKGGITKFQESQRVVTVKGLSEKEVPADKVTWPIVFKEVDNGLVPLYNTLERKSAIVVDFLRENGISEDEIEIAAPVIIDYQAERYVPTEITYRYNGTSIIIVSSNNVDLVRELIPKIYELTKEGVAISANLEYEYPINFEFTQLNSVKPEMVEEATKNARITAEKFASDSESELGKIKTATQGQMSITNRDQNTPHIKILRVVTTVVYYLND